MREDKGYDRANQKKVVLSWVRKNIIITTQKAFESRLFLCYHPSSMVLHPASRMVILFRTGSVRVLGRAG